MRSLKSGLHAIGRGWWRSCIFAGIGLIVPAASALLPLLARFELWGHPWSWTNPWSWFAMIIIVTILTLVFAHPVARSYRRLVKQWSGVTIEDGYRPRPELVQLSTGHW